MPPQVGRPAAEYNNYGTIQQNQPATNADGQLKQNWVQYGFAWFQVVPRGGREKRVFEQLRAEISHIVRCRKNSLTAGILPANFRVVFSSKSLTLNIHSRIELETRNVEYQFECTEVQQ